MKAVRVGEGSLQTLCVIPLSIGYMVILDDYEILVPFRPGANLKPSLSWGLFIEGVRI